MIKSDFQRGNIRPCGKFRSRKYIQNFPPGSYQTFHRISQTFPDRFFHKQISAPFTSEAPPQIFIPQLRRAGGSSFLPVLVIMPAYSRELALELAELPGVTGLVQPLNYAQAVNILRGNGKG